MISPDGFEFWVQNSAGVRFPEHQVETKVEGLKTTMTCFLEIEPGVQYMAYSRAPAVMKNDQSSHLYADGSWILGQTALSARGTQKLLSFTNRPIDASTSLPLYFSVLETTDDDDECDTDQAYLLKLGELEIKTFGGKLGATKQRVFNPIIEKGPIHESSKKGTLVGSKTGFGSPILSDNSRPFRVFQRNVKLPIHHIIFKYRTRQALVLLKVLDSSSVEEKEVKDEKPVIKAEEGKGEGSSTRRGKRKSEAEEPKNVINLIDDDEDVKPFKKARPSDAGGSKDTAIDLS